ncbi:MAG: hypothetical protein KF858_08950 [Candidatus Sumerlaeia bacterium]|nr:hypothetical protein [Candidatus Sumerlaeia bacterium]
MTCAAYVDLNEISETEKRNKNKEIAAHVTKLRSRGYNTLLIPVFAEGSPTVHPAGRRAARRGEHLTGPGVVALEAALALPRTSVWLHVDPLSAGNPRSTSLSPLARKRREWLARNTLGRTTPLGNQAVPDPIFSWINRDWRRFLGDILYHLAEALPFGGIVLDLRHYPGISDDRQRWYCCSFQSQEVTESVLGLSFERLLAEGTREQINAWQRLVVAELHGMATYLMARVQSVRSDVSWKILVPRVHVIDEREAPWAEWFAGGQFDELLLPADGGDRPLPAAMSRYDGLTGTPRLLAPVFRTEQDAIAAAETLQPLPIPGYLVLRPGTDPEVQLPDVFPRWSTGGALEDSPDDAARALARHLEEEFGTDTRCGRFFRRIGVTLDKVTPTYALLDRLRARIGVLRERLLDGRVPLDEEQRHLLREVDLLLRLVPLIRPDPPVT